MNSSPKIEFLLYETYMSSIRNSVGAGTFKNVWCLVAGEKKDITENGRISCAVFVSSILLMSALINKSHATVASTVKDMIESGWQEIETKNIKSGAVILWEPKEQDGSINRHLGFYIGNNQAISNSYSMGTPQTHDWQYNSGRKIEKIFWHDKLGKIKERKES